MLITADEARRLAVSNKQLKWQSITEISLEIARQSVAGKTAIILPKLPQLVKDSLEKEGYQLTELEHGLTEISWLEPKNTNGGNQ